MQELRVVTNADRRDLGEQLAAVFRPVWPEFILHDPVDAEYVSRVESYFERYDVMLLDDEDQILTGGWGVPVRWDGTAGDLPEGYDDAMVRAVTGHEASVQPDTLCIMAVAVRPGYQGTGLAGKALGALRERAGSGALERVIAPVRPTLKSRYPLTPMENFARWTRADGMHLDPWVRAHQRLGATILGPALRSMTITGTVAEWEAWTQMTFPETAEYVVPDALGLVQIDREHDCGTYVEANLWMRHA
ncbi:MAG TPA: GNAT family N-acetyltransferase [Streptosporangiaceae bacterium]|nr:GNAT family N-acetyltransferase [Streptosporangiaceae bacterium]